MTTSHELERINVHRILSTSLPPIPPMNEPLILRISRISKFSKNDEVRFLESVEEGLAFPSRLGLTGLAGILFPDTDFKSFESFSLSFSCPPLFPFSSFFTLTIPLSTVSGKCNAIIFSSLLSNFVLSTLFSFVPIPSPGPPGPSLASLRTIRNSSVRKRVRPVGWKPGLYGALDGDLDGDLDVGGRGEGDVDTGVGEVIDVIRDSWEGEVTMTVGAGGGGVRVREGDTAPETDELSGEELRIELGAGDIGLL